MVAKRFILLIVSAFGILIFFKTETYTRWIDTFILNPNTPISEQFEKTGVEERREYRYQNVYRLCQYIKKTLDTSRFKDEPKILLPPNKYLEAVGQKALHMPEPAEFYYHTGLITLWTTSPEVQKANWAIYADDKGNISFMHIDSPQQLQMLLATYKNYKPDL